MRITFLFFLLMVFGQYLFGQDTIRSLVITEARLHPANRAYIEVTNMGSETIDLSQFKLGHIGGGDQIINQRIVGSKGVWVFEDRILEPGESLVMASVREWGPIQYAMGKPDKPEKEVPDNQWKVMDVPVYLEENSQGDPTDSVSPYAGPFKELWHGMSGVFIQQMFPDGNGGWADSIIVDQVAGMFVADGGTHPGRAFANGWDVAGMKEATKYAFLVRKFSVKEGELDFDSWRGTGLDDSQWIPIPSPTEGAWRLVPWTLGNHGNYELDENTLVSENIEVDFENQTMTVPWGVRRGDAFMDNFEEKPGIGWRYILNGDPLDSMSYAAHTKDSIAIYVCGDELDFMQFAIVVEEPAENVNVVVQMWNNTPGDFDGGFAGWPRVTTHGTQDTIWGPRGGIPYGTRVDSLMERLDIPTNAEWEIVFADGVKQPDLEDGDVLKITAADGSVKEYHIAVTEYRENNNPRLASITWPDIPEFYKGILGWKGDTIPGFGPENYAYNVEVPLEASGMPALVAKTVDLKARVEVKRAKTLKGAAADRTVDFTVFAEDDSTTATYSVVLTKATSPEDLQPYHAKPFISEVVKNWHWGGTEALEICNPGNQPLDLSRYMLVGGGSDLVANITDSRTDKYLDRYMKYIPGYKWTDTEGDWQANPYIAEQDLSVVAEIDPGEVFVMAHVNPNNGSMCNEGVWAELPGGNPLISGVDVHLNSVDYDCHSFTNHWGEEVSTNTLVKTTFWSGTIALYEILNDSVLAGTKPATDPRDFQLIDVIGDGSTWHKDLANGELKSGIPFAFSRKAAVTVGDTIPGGSFAREGSTEDFQWNIYDLPYFNAQNIGWPRNMMWVLRDVGKHFFIPPTGYMSTVTSGAYIVSEGYSMEETIVGVKEGTSVSEFFALIDKADTAQVLTVLSGSTELGEADDVSDGDILKVVSADGTNESRYVLTVTPDGLSSNAVIESDDYTVDVSVDPDGEVFGSGTVSDIPYGTTLSDAVDNIDLPDGANMTIIDGNDAYVPFKVLNYDSIYVDLVVNTNVYLEVIAQDKVTGIVYQLKPSSESSDAFVTSNIFEVNEEIMLLKLVPKGISVENFLANVIPCEGATMRVIDKMGFERTIGVLADDDRLEVTSQDGTNTVLYFIETLNIGGIQKPHVVYMLSEMYNINQSSYEVDSLQISTSASIFLNNVTLSSGAVASIYGVDGEKTGDAIVELGDTVVVSLENNELSVAYVLNSFRTGKNEMVFGKQILLYPNPTNGDINVLGLESGQRVKVYDVYGSLLFQKEASANHEQISISAQPAGIYMIVVSNELETLGKYKVVKY